MFFLFGRRSDVQIKLNYVGDFLGPRWPSGKVWAGGLQARNPIRLKESAVYAGRCTLIPTLWVKRPVPGVVRKLGERGIPVQASSSSSDSGSK
ncbi:hypothetical protein AVEN_57308-1 [Araneus ventricosus]|uniref:Uncharacterized protein n=1 Tax=Araneus ventricosus TaxID=182803 RepID=A0A4Y2IRK4_ARAVE|nr:hypothetical protein AVEN_57308-1 [Araneus ventricosus]